MIIEHNKEPLMCDCIGQNSITNGQASRNNEKKISFLKFALYECKYQKLLAKNHEL